MVSKAKVMKIVTVFISNALIISGERICDSKSMSGVAIATALGLTNCM